MRLVRSVRGTVLVTLLMSGLAACGESPIAPAAEPAELSASDVAPLMARGGSADDDSDRYVGNNQSGMRTFTVHPGKAALKKLGDHVLYIPANVICDPASSGYGPAVWNASCPLLKRPIEISAKWTTINGHAVIRFKQELRFAPSANKHRWVMLFVDASKVDPNASFALLWRNPQTNEWVDESLTDPSLRVQIGRFERIASRRLKHFSDYWLWFGFGSYNVTSGMGGDGGFWGAW